MNKKSTLVIWAIVIAVVFFGAGWGIKSSSSSSAASTATAARGSYTGTFSGTVGARAGRTSGGGLVAGKIVSVDPTSISVALPNSTSTSATTGSTVVLYSSGTSILKSVIGSAADLTVGESVTISGATNSDGSVSANSIQIRPTQGQ
jgi:outer membrane lipoprotein-sorting protein